MTAPPRILLAHSNFMIHDSKQVLKAKPYPPLATLITAAVLRRHGHEVSLFDATLSAGVEEFASLIGNERPPVVAILEDNFNFLTKMCTSRMREAALAMTRIARHSGSFVVVNGPDASDVPQRYLDAGAHAVIAGETEITLPRLLVAREQSRPLQSVRGLWLSGEGGATREPESIVSTPPRPFVENLGSLPLPAWDLVDVEAYREKWVASHGRFSWNMNTTRGCPYTCSWCAKPLYGKRYAQREPADVAHEMERLAASVRPDHIWFADDIFGLSPLWVERLADCLEERGLHIPFTIQSRPDLMNESACRALARAGCEEVWMGVESGAQSVLNAMDKGISVESVRSVTRLLRDRRVHPSWFLQLGYPGEDWTEILATRDLVREEAPHDVGVSVSYPLPGTPFFERVGSELAGKTNWTDSGDLAMLFQGAFSTELYRRVRDLLHEEAEVAREDDAARLERRRRGLDTRWSELSAALENYRSPAPSIARVRESGT